MGHNLFAPILPRREFELDEVFVANFKFWRNLPNGGIQALNKVLLQQQQFFILHRKRRWNLLFRLERRWHKKLFAFLSQAFCPKDIFPSHHHSQFSIQCFFWVCSQLLDTNERSARNVTQNYYNYLLKYLESLVKDKRTLKTHKGYSIRLKSGKKKRTVYL